MTLRKTPLFFLLLLCQMLCAQQNPIVLDEVAVSDAQLKKYSQSQSVVVLNDSVLQKNQSSLSSLLNYNSVIYFKETGAGMVSSPSFRGTTASQTAVVWNGININSQLLGQTDFNTVTTSDYNSVAVRSGGGSIIYGSGAVGGSIHLNNDITFKKEFSNTIQANYGSFNTLGLHYGVKFSNEKFVSQIGALRNNSDNDYEYLGSDLKNENGQFYNTTYTANFGYKINSNNYLKFFNQVFDGQRHFSLASPSDTKTKYKDFNTRNLLEWSTYFSKFISKVKLAYLTEKYHYYENISNPDYFFGKVQTGIIKYDLEYAATEKMTFNTVVDYTQNNGNGSDIQKGKRQIGSASLLMKHFVNEWWRYEASIRKETTNNYESPILFAIGSSFAVSKHYKLKANFSRNFRIPTFNDLYWKGAGNPDLKPESSYQGEIGNELTFGNFQLTATVYHMKIRDMIRWVPGNGGVFSPENTNKVSIFGLETILHWSKTSGKNHLEWNATYAYTNSKNESLSKQLVYVPYHKATTSFGYSYAKFSASFQHLFMGKVFTQTDNNPNRIVDSYYVSNIRADYDFGKKKVYQFGISVLNLWNQNYESVLDRPMPGRNYAMYLTLKF